MAKQKTSIGVATNGGAKGEVIHVPLPTPTQTADSLLRELFQCLNAKTFIQADESSIRFMVTHLQNPPLTLANRCAMRLTVNEYERLYEVLERVGEFLRPPQDEL